jgi:hypothetical protein
MSFCKTLLYRQLLFFKQTYRDSGALCSFFSCVPIVLCFISSRMGDKSNDQTFAIYFGLILSSSTRVTLGEFFFEKEKKMIKILELAGFTRFRYYISHIINSV